MALETFNANDLVYTVSPEPELPDGMKTWAVLEALLVDEITGQPPLGAISLQTAFAGLGARVAPGGKIGFAAIPVLVFPLLRLKNYPVSFTIQAEGYISLLRNETMLSNLAFPGSFAPLDLGTLRLHRLPTVIAGRVVLDTGIAVQAIAGATITLTGLWRTPPPASLVVPPDPPDLVSLHPGLYADRPQLGTTVQGLGFLGGPGADKQLLQQTLAGQSSLHLSDRKLIAAADILAIDTQDPERTEYISIKTVAGASTDDQPALITLDSPLRSNHSQGAIVHKVQFQNAGVAAQLNGDAIAGDVCLFLNAVGNLGGAPFLSLQSGGAPTEYHAAGYFSAVSDAQGFFRMPPLSRVAQCALHSHDGVHTDLDVTYSPDYSQEVSRIDFVYR
jgi:hypothetical protein